MSADQQLSQLNQLLEQIIKGLFTKLQTDPNLQEKLPLAIQQKMLKCEEPLQRARMIAYIIDTFIGFQESKGLNNKRKNDQNRFIKPQDILISEEYDGSPIGNFTEKQKYQNRQYDLLQRMLQKYEAQVRLHIRNEQTMKLHCDQLQQKIGILTKQKQQLMCPSTPGMRDTIQTTRSNRNKLKSNNSDQLNKNGAKSNRQGTRGKNSTSSKKRNTSNINRGNSKTTIQNHGSKSDRQQYFKEKQREKMQKQRKSMNNLVYPSYLNNKSTIQSTYNGNQKSNNKKTKNNGLIAGSLNLQTMNAASHVVRSSRMNSLRANSQARKSNKNQKQHLIKDKQLAKTLIGRKNY